MSSTGVISKTIMTPISTHQEQSRATEAGISSSPGLHEGVRQTFATIYAIHPEKTLIKAYDDNGSNIANDKWVPLNHSSREIAERFGTVRIGMRVMVSFTGPDGGSANAFIVGNEGEKNANEPQTENAAQRGMFRIFAPGSGIG